MSEQSPHDKIRSEIQATGAAELLPHHRRGALLIVAPAVDFLQIAMAVAADDTTVIQGHLDEDELRKPALAELSDWCVDPEIRLQYIILQPYVLAQVIVVVDKSLS